jgi:hypothetical protein
VCAQQRTQTRTSTLVASASRSTRASNSGWSPPPLSGSEPSDRSWAPLRGALSLRERPFARSMSGRWRSYIFFTGDSFRSDAFFLIINGTTGEDLLLSVDVFAADARGVASRPEMSNGMRWLRGMGDRSEGRTSADAAGNSEARIGSSSSRMGPLSMSAIGSSSDAGLCTGSGEGARGPIGFRSLDVEMCRLGRTDAVSLWSCAGVGVTERKLAVSRDALDCGRRASGGGSGPG